MPLAEVSPAEAPEHTPDPPPIRMRPPWFLPVVLVIAAVGLLQALLVKPAAPRPPFFDEQRYQLYADNLVHRGFFGDEAGKWPATAEFRSVSYSAYVPPGYVFFLAPFRAITTSDAPVRVAQALLVGLAIVAASFVAAEAFGIVAGLIAGLLIVATGVLANYSSFSLSEVAAATSLVVSVWFTLIGARRRSWRWLLAAGAVFGVSILVRPQVLLLPPAIAAWLWLVRGRSREGLVAAGAFAAGLVLVVSPWTVRNGFRLHTFVPVSTYTWINFWLVNHSGTDGLFHRPEADIGVEEVTRIRALSEVDQDVAWRRMALTWVRENPGDALRGWVRNGRRFVTDPDHLMQRWYAIRGATTPRLDDRWLFAVALAAIAIAAIRRRLNSSAILLALVALYFCAFFCFFLPTPRFRVGMLPILAGLAAGLAESLWRGGSTFVNWVRVRPA